MMRGRPIRFNLGHRCPHGKLFFYFLLFIWKYNVPFCLGSQWIIIFPNYFFGVIFVNAFDYICRHLESVVGDWSILSACWLLGLFNGQRETPDYRKQRPIQFHGISKLSCFEISNPQTVPHF